MLFLNNLQLLKQNRNFMTYPFTNTYSRSTYVQKEFIQLAFHNSHVIYDSGQFPN